MFWEVDVMMRVGTSGRGEEKCHGWDYKNNRVDVLFNSLWFISKGGNRVQQDSHLCG